MLVDLFEKNNWYFTRRHLSLYLADFFVEWEMFQIKVAEKMNTHFMFKNCFSKILPLMRQCGKRLYIRAGHRWQYDTVHALCLLYS